MPEPAAILLPRLDTFGDIVLLQGFANGLLQHWPEAQFHFLVRRKYAELASLCSPRIQWHASDMEPLTVHERPLRREDDITDLLDRPWSLIVQTQFSRSWLDQEITRYLGVSGTRCVYLGKAGEHLGDRPGEAVPVQEFSHETTKYQVLFEYLTGRQGADLPSPALSVPEKEQSEASCVLADMSLLSGQYVVCVPGGGLNNPQKVWPQERFGECIARVEAQYGLRTLVVGHEAERDIVLGATNEAMHRGATPQLWVGRDGQLALMAALLQRARFYLGNDTGPMHIAQALGVPVVAIYGGWHWPRFAPVGPAFACLAPRLCFGCEGDCLFGNAPCVWSVRSDDVYTGIEGVLQGLPERGYQVIASPSRNQYSESELIPIANRFREVSRTARQAVLYKCSLDAHHDQLLHREEELRTLRLAVGEERAAHQGACSAFDNQLHVLSSENEVLNNELNQIRSIVDELEAKLKDATEQTALLRSDPFAWLTAVSVRDGTTLSQEEEEGEPGLVSAIIPVYNGAPFIERAIRSVWDQIALPIGCALEVVVCDDGSSDASPEIVRELIRSSPIPIRLVTHEDRRNKGVGGTRNRAIAESRGEFIALLDADDEWLPRKTASEVEFLQERPDLEAVCSYGFNCDAAGRPITGWNGTRVAGYYRHLPDEDALLPPYTFELLLKGDPIVNSSLMVRRRALAETGGYTGVMAHQAEDWLLLLKLALRRPIEVLEEPLIRYRVHPDSYTFQYFTSGLAYGARIETLFQLLHWMLQRPEYHVKAQWLYRRHLPVLMSASASAYRLIEDYYRLHNGHTSDVKGFEAHLHRIYKENEELHAYRRHIEAHFDVLRRVPGAVRLFHWARALYRWLYH